MLKDENFYGHVRESFRDYTYIMKWLRVVLVAVLVLTVSEAALDVEKTVQQVQNILQANTQLPRLTREEILQLLNDIRAEDAKSTTVSLEQTNETKTEQPLVMMSKEPIEIKNDISITTYRNDKDNEITPISQVPDIRENIVADEKDAPTSASAAADIIETTSKKAEPSVMVVLPYTPRDGSSLQELYTKPPRIEVIPVSKVTPKPVSVIKIRETLKSNSEVAKKQKQSFPAELQAFLNAHGLKGNPGQDHFLLPLEGFKPLPPAKVVDGSIELPENILLTYDLIYPNNLKPATKDKMQSLSQNDYLYEPLRPQFPLELLDTSSSEVKKTVLPLDLPTRTKSKQSNYEPIDYDSVKVIPLKQGPNPIEEEKINLESEQSKRQTNDTKEKENIQTSTEEKVETVTPSNDPKVAMTNAPPNNSAASDNDTGASIADLEDSFGGAAPEIPGDSQLPPARKNGFYWMLDWNSFLEVGDGDTKVNIRFEPKLGDPQMFLPVNVP